MPRRHNDAILLQEQTAPATPAAGLVDIYAKTDKRLYSKDSAGLESLLNTIIVCTSTTRPASPTTGLMVFETDKNRISVWDGTIWCPVTNGPSCRVYNSASLAIPWASTTLLTFNSERYDPDGMHSTVSNTGRITFAVAGIYEVTAQVEYTGRADWLNEYVGIRLNGGNYIAAAMMGTITVGTIPPILNPKTTYKFAVNDYVEVYAYGHNTPSAGFNVVAVANSSPEFSATWIGRG